MFADGQLRFRLILEVDDADRSGYRHFSMPRHSPQKYGRLRAAIVAAVQRATGLHLDFGSPRDAIRPRLGAFEVCVTAPTYS